MCTCEFCNSEFSPRPQVKKPRACPNCQRLRQRANEKAWREKNLGCYDGKYHSAKRDGRKAAIQEKVTDLLRCIEVGGTLLGVPFTKEIRDSFQGIFLKFMFTLGIRIVNKVWPVEIPSPIAMF